VLLHRDVVELMKPGSVIVDLAAESGGNCELTQPSEVVTHNGITIIGYVDMPSRLAPTASQLYGTNLVHLLTDMGGSEKWRIDHKDEVVRGALILEQGETMWPPPKVEAPKRETPAAKTAPVVAAKSHSKKSGNTLSWVLLGLAALFGLIGWAAPTEFLGHFTVFVLAVFVGYQVVWNVAPALHTPLMSVTNAISGIILVGGMLQISGPISSPVTLLSAAAVLLATINISGGFWVTTRMLRMFQR
jgi:NAD(P) transhydrogenase subunit alpha